MRFTVAAEIFEQFPTACFGVVVAQDVMPLPADKIAALLAQAVSGIPAQLPDGVRQHFAIAAWRTAFAQLGYNPNKFMSSVEALTSRVYKSGHLPAINWIVDLVNALSLTYIVPMGAHDLGRTQGDITLRLSRPGDVFTPFGASETEEVPPGEVVYADNSEVRTRRWVWRQGEKAKILDHSRHIFFPIDGFTDSTAAEVLAARDQLASLVGPRSGRMDVFFVDKEQPYAEWDMTVR